MRAAHANQSTSVVQSCMQAHRLQALGVQRTHAACAGRSLVQSAQLAILGQLLRGQPVASSYHVAGSDAQCRAAAVSSTTALPAPPAPARRRKRWWRVGRAHCKQPHAMAGLVHHVHLSLRSCRCRDPWAPPTPLPGAHAPPPRPPSTAPHLCVRRLEGGPCRLPVLAACTGAGARAGGRAVMPNCLWRNVRLDKMVNAICMG